MGLFEIFILAVGLCMDSFAVSLTSGVLLKPFKTGRILKIATFMAIFQGGMPVIGWLLGVNFQSYIESYDHWIAFALLAFLGSKMIYEGWPRGEEEKPCCFNPANTRTLIGLSIATSIDALAVGIMFAISNIEIVTPALIIGLVTFAASLAGVHIGHRFGRRIHNYAEMLGGIILLGIGIKILLEHLLG